jgi:nucleotide sugar dehydrogenase
MKIGIVGIGKLGLCFALNLERKGFVVTGVDLSQDYIDKLSSKEFCSDEPGVNELLKTSRNFHPTTDFASLNDVDIIFILVATPSLPSGSYNHDQVEKAMQQISEFTSDKLVVIGCTTMPGYCDDLQSRYSQFKIAYNPEFIAQGTVIRDQLIPDMILIGSPDNESGERIAEIYKLLVENDPRYSIMSVREAEITKIALNCFLTTKIAYANMVGDVALASGVNPDVILSAIGADSRIGSKYLKYGYGFGGPCFPRDNRAFGIYASVIGIDALISKATDESNEDHLYHQVKFFKEKMPHRESPVIFDTVTYKPESTILEESQQLKFAVELAYHGYEVIIRERPQVIEEIKKLYGNKFKYEERFS